MSSMEESVAIRLLKQAEGNRKELHEITQNIDRTSLDGETMENILKMAEANGRDFSAD